MSKILYLGEQGEEMVRAAGRKKRMGTSALFFPGIQSKYRGRACMFTVWQKLAVAEPKAMITKPFPSLPVPSLARWLESKPLCCQLGLAPTHVCVELQW